MRNTQKGFYLVEVVMSAAIIGIVSVALFTAYTLYVNIALTNTEKVQAAFLAEEAIEAVKSIRDANWSSITALTPDTTYYLNFSGLAWQTTATPVSYIDGQFQRSVVFESVLRNSLTQDIAVSGTNDPDARKVTATVSWIGPNKATTSVSIATYITNIHE